MATVEIKDGAIVVIRALTITKKTFDQLVRVAVWREDMEYVGWYAIEHEYRGWIVTVGSNKSPSVIEGAKLWEIMETDWKKKGDVRVGANYAELLANMKAEVYKMRETLPQIIVT